MCLLQLELERLPILHQHVLAGLIVLPSITWWNSDGEPDTTSQAHTRDFAGDSPIRELWRVDMPATIVDRPHPNKGEECAGE